MNPFFYLFDHEPIGNIKVENCLERLPVATTTLLRRQRSYPTNKFVRSIADDKKNYKAHLSQQSGTRYQQLLDSQVITNLTN